MISLKYLVTGLVFIGSGQDLAYTPYHLKDFGILPYGCKIEGLLAYMLFMLIILWNFVLTYDVYLTVNKPLVFNENYVFYYKAFVYFTGTMFSLVVFFPNMTIFEESTIYICYIQNGIVYNSFVNLPILLYFVVNTYVSCKYTMESRYKGYTKNKHRIDQILSLYRMYFVLWTIFQFSNLIFGLLPHKPRWLISVHSVIMSFTPINICIVFFRAMKHSNIGDAYQYLDIEMDNMDVGKSNTLLDNMIMLHPPPGMENSVRHQRNPSGSSVTMEQVKKHWSEGDNFKDVLRREVLEYIVKGFEKIFKGGKDEKLGDSHDKDRDENGEPKEKPPLFRRLILC